MIRILRTFANDKKGATALEYGLIAALISVALVVGATTAGTQLSSLFTTIGTKLTTAATAASKS